MPVGCPPVRKPITFAGEDALSTIDRSAQYGDSQVLSGSPAGDPVICSQMMSA
jgi:hypothetical protein